jgi:superfamily I DNA/RNA helicase
MVNLQRLNPSQRQAVETTEGALLLLAGAGTGKTTVITYRIAYMLEKGIDPSKIMALTFTNKAAVEMKERVVSLVGRKKGSAVCLSTFHSFCLSILKKHIPRLGFDLRFSIADEQLQSRCLKQVLADPEISVDDSVTPGVVKQYIAKQKQEMVYLDNIDESLLSDNELALYRCWSKYQELLKNQSLIDFDDLIVMTIRIFWDHPDVLEIYQNQFHYLMVDEYQDTNSSQLELLRLIAGERQNVCAVGDDDQSIYGWRGADISNILEFEQDFSQSRVIRIEENYRCTGKIIAAANTVIAHNTERYSKTLRANAGAGEDIKIITFTNEHREAQLISEMIKEKHQLDRTSYDNFAILFRSNSQSRLLEINFKRLNIPYRIVGSTSFYKRAEIQDAIAYMKVIANPKDDLSLQRILNVPPRGIGSKSLEIIRELRGFTGKSMVELLGSPALHERLSSSARIACQDFYRVYEMYRQKMMENNEFIMPNCRKMLYEIGYLPGLMKIYKNRKEAEARLDNVQEFLNDVAEYVEKTPSSSNLQDYLLRFTLFDDSDKLEGEGVSMLTVHSSKGLEFENVYVVGLERDLFPHAQSVKEGALQEERRLFYVAMTRAKKNLTLSWAKARKVFGKDKRRFRSPFLREVPEDVTHELSQDEAVKPATQEDISKMIAKFTEGFE